MSIRARAAPAWGPLCCSPPKNAACRRKHAVGLETAVDNISALAFYKRHGYSVIRTWPRYYSNGVDALVLKKDLNGESAAEEMICAEIASPDTLPCI